MFIPLLSWIRGRSGGNMISGAGARAIEPLRNRCAAHRENTGAICKRWETPF